MSDSEFEEKSKLSLSRIPEEFRGAISWRAINDCIPCGNNDLFLHLDAIVEDLIEPIKEYTQRILDNH